MTKDYSYLRGDPNDPFVNIDSNIRKKFNELPMEKKEKSLKAKTFIIYPFELFEQQKKPFEQKEQETLEFIENHLKAFKKPYIATSFGSDSVVLMHLVMTCCKKMGISYPDMFLNDTLNTFKEEKQYWADMVKLWGLEKHIKFFKPPLDDRGNHFTVWSVAKKVGHLPSFRVIAGGKTKILGGSSGQTPECCNILKKATMKNHLKSMPKEDRYDLQFVGTRAQESRVRANSLLQKCRSYILKTFVNYHMRACTPLSYWTKQDINAYYEKHQIPMNPAYKAHAMQRMGCASCPAHKNWEIRLAKDPTNEGFGMLKQNFKLMQEFINNGTELPERMEKSIKTLEKYLKSEKSQQELNSEQRARLEQLILEFK